MNFAGLIFHVKQVQSERIDNKNFTYKFFVPELASSLFDNAVKMLCTQAQARAMPEQC